MGCQHHLAASLRGNFTLQHVSKQMLQQQGRGCEVQSRERSCTKHVHFCLHAARVREQSFQLT